MKIESNTIMNLTTTIKRIMQGIQAKERLGEIGNRLGIVRLVKFDH